MCVYWIIFAYSLDNMVDITQSGVKTIVNVISSTSFEFPCKTRWPYCVIDKNTRLHSSIFAFFVFILRLSPTVEKYMWLFSAGLSGIYPVLLNYFPSFVTWRSCVGFGYLVLDIAREAFAWLDPVIFGSLLIELMEWQWQQTD